ncbi:immunoglobulin-like and fibronectin type III domain-containing protein 1 [Xyrichtys novacula]|nr:immunoglobulin-like and fibronectin type III domain-containing protein 1 [Xyrichtys novacula]
MWKGGKNGGPRRQCFSMVHQYIQHFNEVSGNKSAAIRRRSKIPGVMITQYVVNLPEGKSTPDFQSKPMPVEVKEGQIAVFKAIVTGDPKPEVSWRRTKGNILDKKKFLSKYDESTGEHILEIYKVSSEETDTYKCSAVNEFGKAVCTTTLNLDDASANPSDFRRLLRKSKAENKAEDGESDEKFWDAMLKADRSDYERICAEFGVKDIQSIMRKLAEKKKARRQNDSMDGGITSDGDLTEKHIKDLKCAGGTKDNRINGLMQRDIRKSQVDEEVNRLFTELKLSSMDFVIKIEDIKAEENDDALFECVLTHPLPKILWMGKGSELEDGEKYSIDVSDHQLIHSLLIKDCKLQDKGIYSAVAGKATSSAWLVVEERDPSSIGKKTVRRSTLAGGGRIDLEKVAKEQQLQNQEAMERILAAVKTKYNEEQLKEEKILTTSVGGCETNEISGPGKNSGAAEAKPKGKKGKVKFKILREDGTEEELDDSECFTNAEEQLTEDELKTEECTGSGQEVFDKVTEGKNKDGDSNGNEDSSRSARRQGHKKKAQRKQRTSDPNELESDNEESESDEYEDSTDQVEHSSSSKKGQLSQTAVDGESGDFKDPNDNEDTGDVTDSVKSSRRKRQGPLLEDTVIDPGVQFVCGLSDVSAIIHETAELTCKLSSEDCDGVWFRDGKKISPDDTFTISKDGAIHKLIIVSCKEEHSGKYRFEADGRKTEAMINVKDPPRFDLEDLNAFSEPVTVKVGHIAIFKMHFVGHEPIKIQWYKEGDELQGDNNTRIEKSATHSRLLLSRCQRKDSGEIKIKLKNEHGFVEAISQLIVLDKPTPPQGPAEVTESSAMCIEFKWRPPKDDGGSPVINYILERQQVGRNTWKKLGEIPGVPNYRDTDVDHGRKYCYRIRAVTAEGTSEVMETDDMQAGTLAFPGPPAPPKVVSAFDDCINISWDSPSNKGGSRILGYILEKRKKGSNLWTVVNASDELIKEKKYAVKDVVAGMEYEFRVTAINLSGVGEFSSPSEFVFARDPKKPPGKVTSLKVTETSYSHIVLTWSKPEDKPGVQDEAKGYFVEIRPAEEIEWSRCNTTTLITTSYSVKGLKSMGMFWLRVIACNDGGEGDPEELPNYVLAMPSPVRPKFTNHKMKSFMVVRAGNSVRITVNFEASPQPKITWLKDNVPVTKRVTISNSDGTSQLLIPTSERSDTGIYSIVVKNIAGQETFSIEVRVTGKADICF